MPRMTRYWLLTAGLLALAACASDGPKDYFYTPQDPTAKVGGATVTASTEEGGRVEVNVTLTNPNDAELQLTRVQYTIAVDGVGRFRFDDVPERTLNINGEQVVILAAAFAASEPLRGKRYTVSGDIWYDYAADFRRLLNETGYPLPNVSFAGEGRIE